MKGCLSIQAQLHPEFHKRFIEAEGLAGTLLLDALIEAERLGAQLECGVHFDFNGEKAWIDPGMDPQAQHDWLWEHWQRLQAMRKEYQEE